MKALVVLACFLAFPVLFAAHVEWNAPLSDCRPVDLVVTAEKTSYTACQSSVGREASVFHYGSDGRIAASWTTASLMPTRVLPRTLRLFNGKLYLSLTLQSDTSTLTRLVVLDPSTLRLLAQEDLPHFIGTDIIRLPDGGFWILGLDDKRDADILAFRYNPAGKRTVSFSYDSGKADSLGFERRSGAAGPDSSLYIGGFSELLRVAADGTLLWQQPFPSSAIVSRSDGSLIVTHMRAPYGQTAQFGTDGQMHWLWPEGGSVLSLSADQSIWVAGTRITDDTAGWDLALLQLNASGALLQSDRYAGPYQDRAVDLAADAAGNAYVLASTYVKTSSMGTAERYLIMKYDAQCRRLWSQFYGTVGLPEALAVTVDSAVFAVGGDGMIRVQD